MVVISIEISVNTDNKPEDCWTDKNGQQWINCMWQWESQDRSI